MVTLRAAGLLSAVARRQQPSSTAVSAPLLSLGRFACARSGPAGIRRAFQREFGAMASAARLVVEDTVPAVSKALAAYVAKKSAEAIAARGKFTVALSGGSLPNVLADGLTADPYLKDVDWSKWLVLFADERYVPLTDADSNYLACRALFDKVPIPDGQILALDYSTGSLQAAAEDYEARLKREVGSGSGVPSIDLVLLGMGPDGHTCSLFPGHPLLKEDKRLIAWISDSPKPPPERITFTYPLLNAARNVAFVCTGDAKAEVLHNIMREGNSGHYPAGLLEPSAGQGIITWLVDKPAASKL